MLVGQAYLLIFRNVDLVSEHKHCCEFQTTLKASIETFELLDF